jgi:uncharacterized membrane protein
VVTIPANTPPGTYTIRAKADNGDMGYYVTESNEDNNTRDGNLITVAGSDLYMTAVSGPESGLVGKTITITNTVTADPNSGDAPRFFVGIYLHPTTTGSDILIGKRFLSGLVAGQSSTDGTVVTIPANTPPGTYTIRAKADNGDMGYYVTESNEDNNTRDAMDLISISN